MPTGTECADCHQPHISDATPARGDDGRLDASGPIKGASGVSVVNGAANSAPTYTWNRTTALEYELCFKCHSGYTDLPAQDPAHPSRWALDKGIELNPANVSYHPVEAAGNEPDDHDARASSGTSPYKLWNFTPGRRSGARTATGTPTATRSTLQPRRPIDNHARTNRGNPARATTGTACSHQSELYDAGGLRPVLRVPRRSPMVDTAGQPPRHELQLPRPPPRRDGRQRHRRHGHRRRRRGPGQRDLRRVPLPDPRHGAPRRAARRRPSGLVNFGPTSSRARAWRSCRATPTTLGTCTLTCHGKGTTTTSTPRRPDRREDRRAAPCIEGYRGFVFLHRSAPAGPGRNVRPDGWAQGASPGQSGQVSSRGPPRHRMRAPRCFARRRAPLPARAPGEVAA